MTSTVRTLNLYKHVSVLRVNAIKKYLCQYVTNDKYACCQIESVSIIIF